MSERPTFWLLLPAEHAPISVGGVGSALRAYDLTLKTTVVDGIAREDELDANISVLGHSLRLSHHAMKAPEYFVDAAIERSRVRGAEAARSHVSYLSLTHVGGPGSLLEQHLLLVLLAAALAGFGASFIVNPRPRTLLPAAAFDREGKRTIEMLMSISNLVLILGVDRLGAGAIELLVTRGLDAWGSPELAIEVTADEADARGAFKVLEEIVGHLLRTAEVPSAGDRAITSRGAFRFRASTEAERASSPSVLVLEAVHGDLTPIDVPERTA